MFVGIFPSGKPTDGSPHHLLFAMVFFLLSAVDVAIITSFALFGASTPDEFPGPLAIPGFLVVIAALLMLIAGLVKMIPGDSDWSVPDLVDNPPPADQVPRIMFLPSAEWAYVILLNVWVLVFAIFLFTRA